MHEMRQGSCEWTSQSSSQANTQFLLLTDFELFAVTKPINSTSIQKVVKNSKIVKSRWQNPLTPLVIVNLLLRHKQSSVKFLKNFTSLVKKLCVTISNNNEIVT